jgi:hypothetical protein
VGAYVYMYVMGGATDSSVNCYMYCHSAVNHHMHVLPFSSLVVHKKKATRIDDCNTCMLLFL